MTQTMREAKFKTVSLLDPALGDLSGETLQRFMRERDYKIVEHAVLPGEKLTVYHVREVPHGLWEAYVDALPPGPEHDAVRFMRAFECGVERVDNLVQNDGVAISWEPKTKHPRLDCLLMTAEEAQERFVPAERLEIGSVVFQHSFLHRRIANCFRLPSSLLEPLGQRLVHLAAANQSSAADPTSEKPSDVSGTTPTPETVTG